MHLNINVMFGTCSSYFKTGVNSLGLLIQYVSVNVVIIVSIQLAKINADLSSPVSIVTNIIAISWLKYWRPSQIDHCQVCMTIIGAFRIQSSAVITRSTIVRYCINDCRNSGRISIRCWIHRRHPIPCPIEQAMGCLLWLFLRKLSCNGTTL